MASSFSNSDGWSLLDADRPPGDNGEKLTPTDELSPAELERLRSFIVEVSARRPKGAAPVEAPARDGAAAGEGRDAASLATAGAMSARAAAESSASQPIEGERLDRRAEELPAGAPRRRASRAWRGGINRVGLRSAALRRRGMPAFSLSVAVHGILAASLAAVTLKVVTPLDEVELMFSPETVSLEDELPQADVDLPSPDAEAIASDVNAELLESGEAALGDLLAESTLEQLGAGPIGETASGVAGRSLGSGLGDVGTLFGSEGGGLTAAGGRRSPPPPAPEFFGARIEGRRIVFVLDNSGSMQGGRLETVIAELLRCVDSLDPKQEFYVIFHSDTVYPLFYPDPVDRFIRPTDQNKRQLANWLDTVELCLGDSVDEAIAVAAMIEPDTVFLLSDGLIHGTGPLVCC